MLEFFALTHLLVRFVVDLDMGPTTFLPGTATFECHESFTGNMAERDELLGKHEYRRSVLKKGDAAVMDSRTLHFGGPNVSDKRRVLIYFTIRNPLYVGEYPPEGSLWPSLSTMTTKDFV
jgi:ectoine hydroxylase-related dioxygenase (phytanoyl-CoA dioxygenase family)